MKELTEQEALRKLAVYCSASEHCLGDIQEKLESWGIQAPARKRIISRLVEEKYLDEERFCRSFIHDKFKFNKWGKIKIKQALIQKKIDSKIADRYLEQHISKEEYTEVLKELLRVKEKNINASDSYELRGKLVRFALGKGFEMDVILRCLKAGNDGMDY